MNTKSIGFRLAAWYLAVLSTGMLLASVGTWFAFREALLGQLEDTLLERARAVGHFLDQEARGGTIDALREEAREYASGLPTDHGIVVTTDAGETLLERQAQEVGPLYRAATDVSAKGQLLHVELVAPLGNLYHTLDLLRNVLMALVPLMLLIAGAGGWWLSRRALRPVDEMTVVAETLSIENVSARLAVPKTGDELQRLGEAWNRMLDRIAESVNRITRFTMDAAHELRTPVAIMQSSAELALRRERTSEQYRSTIAGLEDEAKRLSQLVQDLLLLARSDAGTDLRHEELVNLSALVAEVVRGMEPLASTKHQSLSFNDSTPGAHLVGDRVSLRRLVMILLDNAIKFSPEGSQVRIELSEDLSRFQLRVQDDGPGMAAEDLPHVFERFYRSKSTRSGPGAGLGLSIAKAITEEHRGQIEMESASGQGTIVTVALPASAQLNPDSVSADKSLRFQGAD